MSERISSEPVVDRKEYPSRMIYLDSEGYVCVADRPVKASPEELAKRAEARKALKKKEVAARKAERDAASAVRKKEREALVSKLKAAKTAYRSAVKGMNQSSIQKAIESVKEATAELEKHKAGG